MLSKEISGVQFEVHGPDQAISQMVDILPTALRANLWLWGTAPPRVEVRLCPDEESFKLHCGDYYDLGISGCVTRDGVVVQRTEEGGLKNPKRFAAIFRHELCHAFWIHHLGATLTEADPKNPEAVWYGYWLCEAVACWLGKDDFLLSREACQGRAEYHEVTSDDFHFRFAMALYEENGKFSDAKVKRMYGLWTSFLTWVSNYDPVAVRNLLTRWKERPTEEGLLAAFERTFGSPFDRKTRQFLAFDWEVSETT